MNDAETGEMIERLQSLEYAIRKSIAVREDQEEEVDAAHLDQAKRCGIVGDALGTKGDLLNAVQTALRSAQARAGKTQNRA